MQLWETGTHVSSKWQVSENCLMHTQAERLDKGVQRVTVPLRCIVCLHQRSNRLAGLDSVTKSESSGMQSDVPWELTVKASCSTSVFFFLLLEDRSLDGWMGEKIEGHSKNGWQFHFPSATLVQHQQAFNSLTYFVLYSNFLSSLDSSYMSMFQSGYIGFEIGQD